MLRSRFQIEFDKKSLALKPYANVELYNAWNVEKVRYTAGLDWEVTKHHALGLFYRYQHVYGEEDGEPNRHILGVGYSLKF